MMTKTVEVKNVSKSFKDITILRDVNLVTEPGHVIGIIGSNGTGKSVLFKLICGFLRPDSGEIYVHGKQVGTDQDFPDNVGALINAPGYIEFYSGFQNLKFLAEIRNIISDGDICETMKRVRLDPDDRKKVKDYSTGMKQKLGIAQAIMEGQDIIILDEPFNGLDFQSAADIREIITGLKQEGKTILLTSHNIMDIDCLCDECYILLNRALLPLTEELRAQYFTLAKPS